MYFHLHVLTLFFLYIVGYVVLLNGGRPPDLVVVYPYAVLLAPFVNLLADIRPKVC